MGFFEKIKNGLKKTRAAMANTLGGIFASFSGANEEFYEELEESMILADIGVETSCKAVEQLRTVVKEPVQSVRLECTVHNPILTDGPTWDCAAVSLRAIDQNGNLLPYCGEAVQLRVDGPLKIIGPSVVPLRGGMAGTYLATTGEAGRAVLHCRMEGALDTDAVVTIRCREA